MAVRRMAAGAFTAVVGRVVTADALVRSVAGKTREYAVAVLKAPAPSQIWRLVSNTPRRIPVELLAARTVALAAEAVHSGGGKITRFGYELLRAAQVAGRGGGLMSAPSAVAGLAADARLTDRDHAIRGDRNRTRRVAGEARGDCRSLDRLPHGLMERSRRKGVMTGRQCKGTNTCVVAERVLEIELIAHLSDESNRMFTRSESPFHRQLGDVLAIVGADSRPLGI